MKKNIFLVSLLFILALLSISGMMHILKTTDEKLTTLDTQGKYGFDQENKKLLQDFSLGAYIVAILLLLILYGWMIRSIINANRVLRGRKFFLRAIIHELKTPLAKGRILAEFIGDTDLKQKSIKNYLKLNNLIDEFANIEKILSKRFQFEKEDFFIDEALERAYEMLDISKDNSHIVIEQKSEMKIQGDYKLFALALKNLIHNGLKYSSDKQLQITIDKKQIKIKNRGYRLTQGLSSYTKPFSHKGGENRGFGLGLYLVSEIASIHSMKFYYQFQGSKNVFVLQKD